VTCEYEHISQVFQSLLSNAVTFMNKPKGLIKVGCVEQGEFWRFYVSDNGPGIEQKYFERIFRIFQTLPRNDEPETAGIGLAVAKKIVELYGGKIWLESEVGKGTTFFFTFPKAGAPGPSEEQVGTSVGAEENYDGAKTGTTEA
jgi:signal transduction histidine kinase